MKLLLKTSESIYMVPFQDIIRCSGSNGNVSLYLVNNRILTVSYLMKDLEKSLPGNEFARVHQSHIVNISFIYQLNRSSRKIILSDSSEVPISVRKLPVLKNTLKSLQHIG